MECWPKTIVEGWRIPRNRRPAKMTSSMRAQKYWRKRRRRKNKKEKLLVKISIGCSWRLLLRGSRNDNVPPSPFYSNINIIET